MIKYSTKLKAIKDIIENNLTYIETANKYRVSTTSIFRWVQRYNRHGEKGLIKTNKLSSAERINMIKYMISRNLSFSATSIEYNVEANFVRECYRKYKEYGENVLKEEKKNLFSEEKIQELLKIEPNIKYDVDKMTKEELAELAMEYIIKYRKLQYLQELRDSDQKKRNNHKSSSKFHRCI